MHLTHCPSVCYSIKAFTSCGKFQTLVVTGHYFDDLACMANASPISGAVLCEGSLAISHDKFVGVANQQLLHAICINGIFGECKMAAELYYSAKIKILRIGRCNSNTVDFFMSVLLIFASCGTYFHVNS